MPEQDARRSPSSSAGMCSTTGSRPTTSWLLLRSTAAASRSEKCVTATVAIVPANLLRLAVRPLAAFDRGLQGATRGELRDARRRDVHLLSRVARIDAHARLALLRLELSKACERDVATATQRVGDRFEKCVDRLGRIARAELAPPRNFGDELLLGHVPLLPLLDRH